MLAGRALASTSARRTRRTSQAGTQHGAEWEHWVERAEAARVAFARLVGAEPDEVAVTTSVSQGVSALVSALPLERGAEPDRDLRVRVPDGGPDRARAGAARGRGRPRSTRARRADPARALRGGDRRADGARLLHGRLVPHRVPARRRARSRASRTSRARSASRTATRRPARSRSTSRALGVDFLTAGTVKYLLASAGLAFMFVRRDLHERLLPTQTGWFADEDIFRMDISDYSPARDARRFDAGTPPVPNIYAGLAGMAIVEEVGRARRSRPTCAGSSTGCSRGSTSSARPSRLRVAEGDHGPLVCVVSTDPNALVAALQAERIVTSDARREPPHLAPPLQRRGGHRPDPRRACAANRALLA